MMLWRKGLRQQLSGHAWRNGALFLRDCYPINVLGRIKDCPEVCSVFCATANPLEVLVAESALVRWIRRLAPEGRGDRRRRG